MTEEQLSQKECPLISGLVHVAAGNQIAQPGRQATRTGFMVGNCKTRKCAMYRIHPANNLVETEQHYCGLAGFSDVPQ